MSGYTIDINCDLGEIEGYDNHAIMPYIQSCNIACGGHAGNLITINKCIKDALTYNLNIGAHPSYPDLSNFGRKSMNLSDEYLYKSIYSQLDIFMNICKKQNAKCTYVKPHGALYHDICNNKNTFQLFEKVLVDLNFKDFILLRFDVKYHSTIGIKKEIFLDRAYEADLQLRSREFDDAIIHDKEAIIHRLKNIREHQQIKCIDGINRPIKADSICIHSDTENAVEIAKLAYVFLSQSGSKY